MEVKQKIDSLVKMFLLSNVVLKDEEDFKNKLSTIITDGVDNLQFVADFDDTLTKHTVNGKKTFNSFQILYKTKTLSQSFLDRVRELYVSIKPLLIQHELTKEEQQQVDDGLEEIIALTVGEKVNTPLKDGCREMLSLLASHRVPIIIVSAGSGDVINYLVRGYGTRVVANFYIFDEGRITDYLKPGVGIYNKNKRALPVDDDRHNIVLFGDQTWDSKMADNVPNVKTILKVGFFYGNDEMKMRRYLEHYDVLLLNDESTDKINDMFRLVTGIS
ncbi:7-methylguanosine phosphate-specific 5'-nucleotidase [Homalodisca vitripennis]|nr:7-methylguanosine phosphate-specific 5'-nucleotidase [Homalodisca vitripennis]KAG8295195.1 7-methylguanosine phosphate-specific 5'-nucleotidase [Homalodisca vitripennis]